MAREGGTDRRRRGGGHHVDRNGPKQQERKRRAWEGQRHGHTAAGGTGRGRRRHGREVRRAVVAHLSSLSPEVEAVLSRRIPAGNDPKRSRADPRIERERTHAKGERSTSKNHGGQPSRRRRERLPRLQNQRSQRQTPQKELRIFHLALLKPDSSRRTDRRTGKTRQGKPGANRRDKKERVHRFQVGRKQRTRAMETSEKARR
eukprot:scaffold109_cov368-Pavlova_lutheri.AAC.3